MNIFLRVYRQARLQSKVFVYVVSKHRRNLELFLAEASGDLVAESRILLRFTYGEIERLIC